MAKRIGMIPSGAMTLMHVDHVCEKCGKAVERVYVVHAQEELRAPLRVYDGDLARVREQMVEMDGEDVKEVVQEALAAQKVGSWMQGMAEQFAEFAMQKSVDNLNKVKGRIERMVRKGDYSFVKAVACECGHVQSWMGRQKRWGAMVIYVGLMVMIAGVLSLDVFAWVLTDVMEIVLMVVLGLLGVLLVLDGYRMLFGKTLLKSEPKVKFEEIRMMVNPDVGW
jgi:hypothetical protein